MVEKFEEKTPEIKPEEIKGESKTKAEIKQEWREHFGVLAEVQEEKEKMEKVTKRAEREAKEEKVAVETAKIPEKGMKTEEVLKEAGIEKPAESFDEVQKRLGERIEKARVRGGEKLSLADKNEITRDFYLGELGWSVKYEGLLRGNARLLDLEGKYVVDKKGKPMEFKTYFKLGRKETPLIDFLKEELGGKSEGKPEKTEEGKWETGHQKAVNGAKREQATRVERIDSLADAQKVGRGRLEKIMSGLSYIAALDKLGVLGLREGKKLAIEGGKDLMAIGLSPAVAIEEAGREITGRIQVGEALRKGVLGERKIEMLEKIPAEKRPEYYGQLLESIKGTSQTGTEEMIKGYDKMYKKGRILRFLEAFGGRFGRVMGERLEPKTY